MSTNKLLKKNVLVAVLLIIITILISPYYSFACVGKTIVIGSKDSSVVQRLMDEIVALLINERTGTSVKIMSFDTPEECRKAIISSEVDMYVEYTGSALTEVLNITEVKDSAVAFDMLKDKYNEKFNLVWLNPYGFEYPDGLKSEYKNKGISATAAPVIRKDTLKKFPALSRLLAKLGGKISNETLASLVKSVEGDNYKAVARKFLKDNKLI